MKAPTPKRNEQMSLSHKKYFANFIKSGASYKSFAFEYLRIFKKSTSRSTYHRIKKNADSILSLVTHRTKNATYNRQNEDELKQFERHCRKVIISCHERKFAIRLNPTAVAQVMENESEKFTFPWLKTMQFHYNYVMRFMKEYDLIFSSKQSNQVYIPKEQMDLHRNEFETFNNVRSKMFANIKRSLKNVRL